MVAGIWSLSTTRLLLGMQSDQLSRLWRVKLVLALRIQLGPYQVNEIRHQVNERILDIMLASGALDDNAGQLCVHRVGEQRHRWARAGQAHRYSAALRQRGHPEWCDATCPNPNFGSVGGFT
jgi:hypothetical protein